MPTPFERFFAGGFEALMRGVRGEPGLLSSDLPLAGASWDRKAAYLLWVELGRPGAEPADSLDALLG